MWAEYRSSQVSALIRSRNDTDREGSNKAGKGRNKHRRWKKKATEENIERTKEEKANKEK